MANRKNPYNDDFDIDIPPMVKYHPEKRTPPPPKGRPPQGRPPQSNGGRPPQNNERKNGASHGRPPQGRPPQGRPPQNRAAQNRPQQGRPTQQRPPRPENKINNKRPPQKNENDFSRQIKTVNKARTFFGKYPWIQPLIIGFIVFFVIMAIAFGTDIIGGKSGNNNQPETPTINESQNTPLAESLNAGTVQGNIRQWSEAKGGFIEDKDVMNVLLLGVDDENGISRSDAMIVASINKRTKKLTLYSIYRDCYAYMAADNGEEHFNKITAAYQYGGGELSVKTVESLFKIKIDHYVSVNFKTFPQIIDILGGVNVDVEKYEADFIRRTSRYKNMPYGKGVKLTGDQALVYSRIRKCDADSDVSRARRQRKVIDALIKKTKSASVGQLVKIVDGLLPYIVTDFTKPELISTGTLAITQKWMDYEIIPLSCLTDGENGWSKDFENVGNAWLVDYPSCAKKMQETLYGKSFITLQGDENTRLTPKELFEQGLIYE